MKVLFLNKIIDLEMIYAIDSIIPAKKWDEFIDGELGEGLNQDIAHWQDNFTIYFVNQNSIKFSVDDFYFAKILVPEGLSKEQYLNHLHSELIIAWAGTKLKFQVIS